MTSQPIASSSSSNISTHLSTSQSARATQNLGPEASMSSQLAQIFALVGQLQSASEAQLSTNARLSSEIEGLRRTVEDQDRVIGELSRSSGGFWVWESEKGGDRGRGRWVHSLEKYRLPSPSIARREGPPTSLDSLPVELLSNILALLSRSEQASMCSTSMRFLDLASKPLYKKVKVDMRGAVLFLNARLSTPLPPSFERVHPFLHATVILLQASRPLVVATPPLNVSGESLPLNHLAISLGGHSNPTSVYETWSPILRLFDPRVFFHITCAHGRRTPPTLARNPESFLTFLDSWSHLERVSCSGRGTLVYFKEVGNGRKLFILPSRRSSPEDEVEISLSVNCLDGTTWELGLEDEDALERLLKQPFALEKEEILNFSVEFNVDV